MAAREGELPVDIQEQQGLINEAQGLGLSAASAGILVNNLSATTVQGAQGTTLAQLNEDNVTVFLRIIDKSGSMSPNQLTLISSANEQLKALKESKSADSILMSTWTFNETADVLHGYLPLDAVDELDVTSYDPDGSTNLFGTLLDAITSMVAYVQQLRAGGVTLRVVMVILTDGADTERKADPAKLKTVITDLIQQEIYTFAFVAFGFNAAGVASSLGIPPANVLSFDASAHDVRLALNTTSASVIRASQSVIGSNSSASFFS